MTRRIGIGNPPPGGPDGREAISHAGRYTSAGLLVGMGVLAVAFLGVVLLQTWRWTHEHIDQAASQQARLAVAFDKALRDYVGKRIRPEMEKRVEHGEFVPEAMSTSFVARSVFDEVRKIFPDTVLRFASTNPRNPVNRATPSEESLIQYFVQHPETDEWSGTMEFFEQGEKYFVCAVPRRFEASCLPCHGRAEDAPASLLERYGTVAGFGRSVGEVSVDLAAVPVSTSYVAARAQVWRRMLTALSLCVLFLVGIASLIRVDAKRRRSAEKALRNSEERFRSLFEAMREGTAIHELILDSSGRPADYRIVDVNPAFTAQTGLSSEVAKGSLASELYGSTPPPYLDTYADVAMTGESRTFDSFYAPLNRYFRVSVFSPRKGWFVTVFDDITERKQMEEALRASEERLRRTLDAAQTVAWEGDLLSDALIETGPVAALFGLPKSTTCTDRHAFVERIHPDDRERVLAAIQSGAGGADAYEIEYRVPLPDGGVRWIQATGRFDRDADGRPIRLRGISRDITERKQAEKQQAESLRKVSEINQELKDFAYVVSHDLKAPLRAIKTLADWLSTDYQDKLDEQGKENLRLLSSRVDRMHNLIDGVLQYSRIGRTEQGTVPVDLRRLVPEIIDNLGTPEHIAIRVEPDLPTVEADATRITQVFQNLLSNAIKYMDKPQGNITVGCAEDDGLWTFSVADNGPGIARKDFERIFKLFQTLAPRDNSESTGVGLTVAKKIVEMYGGRIWVESEVGTGSTFFFTFPKQKEAAVPECLAVGAAP
jgi:two-component system sensor kinase FixL